MTFENASLQSLKEEYARLVAVDGIMRRHSESREPRLDTLAARIRELDPRSNVNPALDRVVHDALQLSFAGLERLIGRLTAERDDRWKEMIGKREEGRPEESKGDAAE